MTKNNIYLTGMMGSGKSVTGKALAVMLDYGFLDLDQEIEKREGRSITGIFAVEGESYFRDVETAVLKWASNLEKHVFSTGGGIVLRDENVGLMRRTGKVILLEASPEVLWERVCRDKNRPLLQTPDPKSSLEKILDGRRARYKATCDYSVMTDDLTAEAAAKNILTLIK
ncbi:MAG: Shikimate kinase 1 [Candidatus Omnitrophica bacterium ADurb.Bin277]|nr:MAG: Shikimate kinase 1 [Candidatus Omnitrophica bacterium ADurb.Bin277]